MRISDHGTQPTPKKHKMDQMLMGQGSSDTLATNINKKDSGSKQTQQKMVQGDALLLNSNSAPAKMTYYKKKEANAEENLETKDTPANNDEAIPAATYEPSDSSDDFPTQLNNVWEDGAESSGKSKNIRLAR